MMDELRAVARRHASTHVASNDVIRRDRENRLRASSTCVKFIRMTKSFFAIIVNSELADADYGELNMHIDIVFIVHSGGVTWRS